MAQQKVFVYDASSRELLLSVVNDLDTTLATYVSFSSNDNCLLVGYNNALCTLFDSSSGKVMEYGVECRGTLATRILCSPNRGTCFILAGPETVVQQHYYL
jgi:hypothetical protein